MINWEGAEIYYYYNGESYSFSLSNTQFAIIAKILGLELNKNGDITCFSDETLQQLINFKGNPLKLEKI